MLHLLFYFWLFSLLFGKYPLIGTLSLDNLLAPVLFVLSVFLLGSKREDPGQFGRALKTFGVAILLYFFYSSIGMLKFINMRSAFMQHGQESLKIFLYFSLPLMYIREKRHLDMVNVITISIAIVACISAFLASLGLVNLGHERFEASRLGIEFMPKAIGFIGAYGELTILVVYTFLLLWDIKRHQELAWLDKFIWKFGIFLAMVAGLLGSQSRNLFLSVCLSLVLFWYLRKLTVSTSWLARNKSLNVLGLTIMVVSVTVLLIFSPYILDYLMGMAGKTGEGTAKARLEQYAFAMKFFITSPIVGVPAEDFIKYFQEIRQTHNIWIGVAANNGLLGCIIMLLFFITGFLLNLARFADKKIGPQAALFVTLLGCMFFSSNFYPAQSSYIFWTYLGVIFAVGRVRPTYVNSRADV